MADVMQNAQGGLIAVFDVAFVLHEDSLLKTVFFLMTDRVIDLVWTQLKGLRSSFKSLWKRTIAPINGETLTLDDIGHHIRRPTFGDARVHFVINCASKSCPPLLSAPPGGAVVISAAGTGYARFPQQ